MFFFGGIQLGESTALETLKRFCRAVVNVYGEEYLRRPNENDLAKILAVSEERGFPGMLGSLDCMHWGWKNCPISDHGQYTGKEKEPMIILNHHPKKRGKMCRLPCSNMHIKILVNESNKTEACVVYICFLHFSCMFLVCFLYVYCIFLLCFSYL